MFLRELSHTHVVLWLLISITCLKVSLLLEQVFTLQKCDLSSEPFYLGR